MRGCGPRQIRSRPVVRSQSDPDLRSYIGQLHRIRDSLASPSDGAS